MSIAKEVKPATLSFVLGAQLGPGGQPVISREDAVVACVAAIVADGGFRNAREMLTFAMRDKISPVLLREAILHVAPFAGLVRVETGLAALAHASEDADRGPVNPLDEILTGGPRSSGEGKNLDPNDEKPAGDGAKLLQDALGEAGRAFEGRLQKRSKTLARWFKDLAFAQVFARGFPVERRLMLSIAAVFPLDARIILEELLNAAKRKGATPAVLWALHDLLVRLFREGPEMKSAKTAFENVLGRRHEEEFGPGKDPFRWD